MSRAKLNNSIFSVLSEAVKLYCVNFPQFAKYMLFPVLGQVVGLAWIFGMANLYTSNLPLLIEEFPAFNDFSTIILCVILIVVPGMIVWMKAFWDYLVAYGALNSMTESALNTGKVYDFPAHNSLITRRTFKYVGLWLLYGIFGLLAINPLLWVLGGIFFIYFILIFQIFTFETDATITGCFKRSFELIKGNFARTFVIMAVVGLFTHFLFVEGFSVFFDFTKLTDVLVGFFENWVTTIPLEPVNQWLININPGATLLTPLNISQFLAYQVVGFVVISFTLPLRSICWTLWYKVLSENSGSRQERKSAGKNSRKVKKLDKNIIDRATRKED